MKLRFLLLWPTSMLALWDAFLSRLRPSWDGVIRGLATSKSFETERQVTHNGVSLTYRARTFSSKEPETLEWIDGLRGVFWDVGANVGLYSIYFAKKHNARAYAFEPSVFNLELLARNVHRNAADVTIVPVALSSTTRVDRMRLSSTAHAGALSSFGVEYGGDGKSLAVELQYSMLGISIDDVVKLGIPGPDHIKIDVDGVEHEILTGAKKTLLSVRSVLVEINERFVEQAQTARRLLAEAGFRWSNESYGHPGTHNDIWVRP
jgi:FkbM family methyltransferase